MAAGTFTWILAVVQYCAVFDSRMHVVHPSQEGAYPSLYRAGNSASRCLRAGASVRAGLPHRILFTMARFSAYICHRGAIPLRHAACIEHPLQKEGNKRCQGGIMKQNLHVNLCICSCNLM